jgi:hypothetical protein
VSSHIERICKVSYTSWFEFDCWKWGFDTAKLRDLIASARTSKRRRINEEELTF